MSRDRRSPLPLLSTRRLRRALLTLLAVDAVTAWVVILGVYAFLERAWRGLGPRVLATSPIETHFAQLQAARRVQGLAWVATAVIFLLWLYRVHRNMSARGGLEFTPRSAVNAFLVPLANLVLPVRVMAELWRAREPPRLPGDGRGATAVSPVILWWWILFVAATLADPPVSSLLGSVEDIAIGGSTLVLMAGQLAQIASAVLAIVIVRTIDRPRAVRVEAETEG
jgi:Domain of unknown function (DUF4328)